MENDKIKLIQVESKDFTPEMYLLLNEGLNHTGTLKHLPIKIAIFYMKKSTESRSKYYFYFLINDNEPIGFINFYSTKNSDKIKKIIEVDSLYVKEKQKGYGSFIITEFQHKLKKLYTKSKIKINLSTNEIEDPHLSELTNKFYLKHGFEYSENDLTKYFEDGYSLEEMAENNIFPTFLTKYI